MERNTQMQDKHAAYRFLVTIACLVIVVAGLRVARSLLVPFLLATFFAVILTPILHWLQTKGVRTAIALLIILGTFTLLGSGLLLLVGKSVNDFSEKLPAYEKSLTARTRPWIDWLDSHGIELPDIKTTPRVATARWRGDAAANTSPSALPGASAAESANLSTTDVGEQTPGEVPGNTRPVADNPFNTTWLLGLAKSMLSGISDIFGNALVIFITVTFMLLESATLPAKIQAAFGKSNATAKHIGVIVGNVRRYVAIKTATSALTGVLVTLALMLLRVDYPILWGLLAFLFNFIPNVGSIMAAIPAVGLALLQAGVPTALGAAAVYVAVNCFISYVIEPRYMGQGLGLSTLVVFLSLVFWGWVLGPIGMLLSPPLTMIVKIILDDYEETRWLAIFLSSRSALDATSKTA